MPGFIVHIPYPFAVYKVVGVCLSGVSLSGRFHTQRLGTSRTPIALRKVALPSSTHSRLCVELLPGNHLDRAQVLWLCVCECFFSVCMAGTTSPRDYRRCLPQVCINDGLLTAINSQCVHYCQVWAVFGCCPRGCVQCICVCACLWIQLHSC